jgi:L-lactate dehydrogenase complex protein LldG
MPETTNAREAILNRIRAANEGNTFAPAAQYHAIDRAYQQTATLDRAAILTTFIERLHEYDAHVFETTSDALPATIGEILIARSQKSAVVADDFSGQALPEGFTWQWESTSTTDQLNTAEGAISGCEVAIAHTGTIILKGARKLTLLPDRYLCVVREDQIVETVPEAIAALEKIAAEPLTFISGPSATADIEMTRIRGVHGPRFLDVVLVRS